VNHLAAICLQQIGLILCLSVAGVFIFNRNKQ
jgi:hypothetical protein